MKLIDKSALAAEIERLVNNYDKALDYEAALEDVRDFLDSLEAKEPQVKESAEIERDKETCKENGNSLTQEPVSEDLEIAANEWDAKASFTPFYMALDDKGNPNGVRQDYTTHAESFKAGAKWQKENLWKPADGDDLPEIDREVIVLVDNFGKLIPKLAKRTYHLIENFVDEDTGEIISIENTNEVGDVINWIEPAIYWLDVDIPK